MRISCTASDFYRLLDLMYISIGRPDSFDSAAVVSTDAIAWPDDYPYICVDWIANDCKFHGVLSYEYDDFWYLFLHIDTLDDRSILVCGFEVDLPLIADCNIFIEP